jgi:hypothetical protein
MQSELMATKLMKLYSGDCVKCRLARPICLNLVTTAEGLLPRPQNKPRGIWTDTLASQSKVRYFPDPATLLPG